MKQEPVPASTRPWRQAFLLPVLTIFSFAAVYYYEAGFFAWHHIPTSLLRISLTDKANLIVIFFTVSMFVFFVAAPFALHLSVIFGPSQWKTKTTSAIILVLGVGVVTGLIGTAFNNADLVILFISILLCLIIRFCTTFYPLKAHLSQFYFFRVLLEEWMKDTLALILLLSMSCVVMFYVSWYSASKEWPVATAQGGRLLRAYSDYTIYSDTLPGNRAVIMVQYRVDRKDTLYIQR